MERLVLIGCLLCIWFSAGDSSSCPDACLCITSDRVECRANTVSRIPPNISNSISVLILSYNIFSNNILSRSNFTRLSKLQELHLPGCGIETIRDSTFRGESAEET